MRQIDPRQPSLCSQTTPTIIPPAGLRTWAEERRRVEGYSVSLGSLPRTHCESHTPLRPSSQPLPTEYQGQILPPEPGALHVCPSSIVFLLPCICPKARALPPAFNLTHPSRTRSNPFSPTVPSGIPYLPREAWR